MNRKQTALTVVGATIFLIGVSAGYFSCRELLTNLTLTNVSEHLINYLGGVGIAASLMFIGGFLALRHAKELLKIHKHQSYF